MGIQESTKRLYAGHAFHQALTELGYKSEQFVIKDMTNAETLIAMAGDNQVGDMSTNDPIKLKAISVELQKMEVNIERMGYSMKEINAMQPRREVVEDDPPEVQERVITKTGDLWHLGKHRVLCGDSTVAGDVERVMGGEKADICVTSPPYFNQRPEYSQFESYAEYNRFLESALSNVKQIAGLPFVLVWNTGDNQPDCLPMVADQTVLIHELGFTYLDTIVWRKAGAVYSIPRSAHIRTNQKYYPALCWEPIIVFRLGETMPAFDISDVEAVSSWGMNVWEMNQVVGSEQSKIGHPAIYPVELAFRSQMSYSSRDSMVYDPFLGSGTTLIAADQLDRVCFGIEISPRYCDVIVKRYINHSRFDAAGVSVERGGKTLTWEQAERKSQLPKVV
jgi:site-specific DNA-methyltransferase (adenine-specific)